jgi:hypothetical protein
LLLTRSFASRVWFDAACNLARVQWTRRDTLPRTRGLWIRLCQITNVTVAAALRIPGMVLA